MTTPSGSSHHDQHDVTYVEPTRAADTLPWVVVVAADLTRGPDTFPSLVSDLADRAGYLPVMVRPAAARIRSAELAGDILDNLGRVGTREAVGRLGSRDLMLLVPFLLTDEISDLVLFNADWLDVPTLEEIHAVAAAAGLRLWLVLGDNPTPRMSDLLENIAGPPWQLSDAQVTWHVQPRRPANPVADSVIRGHTTADQAREELLTTHGRPITSLPVVNQHTRITVQPAIEALSALRLGGADKRVRLTVQDVAVDAATIRTDDSVKPVPPDLRPLLLRQRIHALVVGQGPRRQYLSYDGSPVSESAVS